MEQGHFCYIDIWKLSTQFVCTFINCNEPYYSTVDEKQYCSSWQIPFIADLLNKNITFKPGIFKFEAKEKQNRYVVDELFRSHGRDLFQLPIVRWMLLN